MSDLELAPALVHENVRKNEVVHENVIEECDYET